MNRRTLLVGTGLFATIGVSARALALDTSLPMKAATSILLSRGLSTQGTWTLC